MTAVRMKNPDLKLYELHSLSEMEKIREDWKHLVLNCPAATPFQTWEWNFGIAKFERGLARLRVILAEESTCVVVHITSFCI